MACQMDRVLLEEYADGLLSKLERLLIEQHIKSCDSCKRQLTEMKLLFWEIKQVADEPIALPEQLNAVGEELVKQFGRVKPAEKAVSLAKGSMRSVKSACSFSSRMPLIRGAKAKAGKAVNKMPSLASKAVDKLMTAGRSTLKNKLGQLLGGSK